MAKGCNERGSFKDQYDAQAECKRLKDKYGCDYTYYCCNLCGNYHVVASEHRLSSFNTGKCTDKFGNKKRLYKTEDEALEACDSSSSSATSIYYCRKCKGYHLTSHPRDIKGFRK